MNNVVKLRPEQALRAVERLREKADNSGGPPTSGGGGITLEARVVKLEFAAEKAGQQLAQIDVRLARIEAKQDEFTKHYATRADLTEAKNSIILWVVSAILLAQLLPALLKQLGL